MKRDLILFISFLLIITGLVILTYYFYVYEFNECTSDPLKYAVKRIRESYGADYVSGTIWYSNNNSIQKSWDFGNESIYNIEK